MYSGSSEKSVKVSPVSCLRYAMRSICPAYGIGSSPNAFRHFTPFDQTACTSHLSEWSMWKGEATRRTGDGRANGPHLLDPVKRDDVVPVLLQRNGRGEAADACAGDDDLHCYAQSWLYRREGTCEMARSRGAALSLLCLSAR